MKVNAGGLGCTGLPTALSIADNEKFVSETMRHLPGDKKAA